MNWEIAVPNGEYAMIVDFGEDHYTQGCEAEGVLCHDAMGGTGEAGSACIFQGAVTVTDGRFTATGYSHDSGLCHSISMVQIRGGAGAAQPIEARVCEGSTLEIACDEGTIDVMSASYGRQHGPDVCPHSATSDQNCDAVNSLDIVSAACQGEQACAVAATNSVFGDPCGGTYARPLSYWAHTDTVLSIFRRLVCALAFFRSHTLRPANHSQDILCAFQVQVSHRILCLRQLADPCRSGLRGRHARRLLGHRYVP